MWTGRFVAGDEHKGERLGCGPVKHIGNEIEPALAGRQRFAFENMADILVCIGGVLAGIASGVVHLGSTASSFDSAGNFGSGEAKPADTFIRVEHRLRGCFEVGTVGRHEDLGRAQRPDEPTAVNQCSIKRGVASKGVIAQPGANDVEGEALKDVALHNCLTRAGCTRCQWKRDEGESFGHVGVGEHKGTRIARGLNGQVGPLGRVATGCCRVKAFNDLALHFLCVDIADDDD